MCIFIFRNEKEDVNIDVIPHISMANKSSWNIPQNPTKDYDVPPDSFRESTYLPKDDSDDSCENDYALEEKSEMPSNPEVFHDSKHNFKDMLLASNNAVRPDDKQHFYKPRRSRMPLPHTPLQSSLCNLEISDSSTVQLPADSQGTDENILDYEEMDEHSYSMEECKKTDLGLPKIENPQKKLLAFTHPKSNKATWKDTQNYMQEDKSSDETDGYVIEQIHFEPPLNGKKQSPYLEVTSAGNEAIYDDRSEYYEWCEVKQLQKPSPISPVAATTRSGACIGCSSVHQISQLYNGDTKASQCMDTSHSVALSGERTYSEARSFNTEIKQSNIAELQCVDSNISNYVCMYKVNNPKMKTDSYIYTYDYVHHPFVQMCKHRRRCTGVPPRRIKRTECQTSIRANEKENPFKEHKTCGNIIITENHSISLPPRKNHNKPTPKRRTTYKPPMPKRNIARPGCYLSAPSAVPKII